MQRRVLILSNMYPGKLAATFGIFVKNQAEAIRQQGLTVDVVAVKDPRMGKKYVVAKYVKWLLHILYTLVRKGTIYEVVHAHYVFPTGMAGLLFKKLFGTRFIVTAHGGDIDRMAKKSAVFQKLTQKTLMEADHVIAVGETLKQEIVETYHVSPEKISVINMGVNRNVFQPKLKKQARTSLKLDTNARPVLFIGNIIKEKGVVELIEAYRRLKPSIPPIELHIIGSPKKESFLQELEEKINKQNIQHVHFHGSKPQSEVSRWMAAAEILVLPSYMEGFGLVALEAMSCHTPVVGSEVGGLKYLLADQHGVLVKPKDISSLYEGLHTVLTNQNLQKALIENGENRAQENDQDYLVKCILDVYFCRSEPT